MKKILIIGASGFIGSHLIEQGLAQGKFQFIGVDTYSTKIQPWLNQKNFEFFQSDYQDLNELDEIIQKTDLVLSLAALCNPAQYNTVPLQVIESNYTQPMKLVEKCHRYNTPIIHLSTSEIYGRTLGSYVSQDSQSNDENSSQASHPINPELVEDETPYLLGPIHEQRWSYASAKQLLERSIYAYGDEGLPWIIVRPFNFIGSRLDYMPGIDGEGTPRVIANFMKSLLSGEDLQLVDGGSARRCFTDIQDAVDAIFQLIENFDECQGEVYNLGAPGNEVSIQDLALQMRSIFRKTDHWQQHCAPVGCEDAIDSHIVKVSSEEFYGKGYADSDRRIPSIEKIQSKINWTPQVSLETSLTQTIHWFIERYG